MVADGRPARKWIGYRAHAPAGGLNQPGRHPRAEREDRGRAGAARLRRTLPVRVRRGSRWRGTARIDGLAAYDVQHARVIGRCEPTTGIKPFTARWSR